MDDRNQADPRFETLFYLVVLVAMGLSLWMAPPAVAEDNPHGDLDRSCADCHTIEGWTPLKDPLDFDHAETGFPLEGSHKRPDCMSCHLSLRFPMVPTACVDCHEDPHRGELGFDCDTCHQPAGWENRRRQFDLHSTTLFPLTGAHSFLDCESCHREVPPFEYSTTPTDCFACHVTDYESAENPDHLEAGFPTDCEACHTTVSWGTGDFDHELVFPLTGAHRFLDCELCHTDGFAGTPTDCYSCHQADYNSTTNPNHQAAGFGTMCEDCHTTDAWQGGDFDHDTVFVLEGTHRSLDCDACHAQGFTGTPTDCVDCHRADYDATTDPNHAAAGFPTDCEQCHRPTSWDDADDFDHDSVFALEGQHRNLDCELCHTDGFAGTPRDCVACHQQDYNQTTDPNHADAGFPTDCEECHTPAGWDGADFDHDASFALTGSHRNLDCDACHADGFAGTPTDCVACHQQDYNQTNDPDHQSAGFPTSCEDCHNTTSWDDADFDHALFFPLNGDHAALDCSECHVNPNNFGVFTCTECHEHRQEEMDDEHDDVPGYVWESQACLDCHPDGRE